LVLDRLSVDLHRRAPAEVADEDPALVGTDRGVPAGDAPSLQHDEVLLAPADPALVVQAPDAPGFIATGIDQYTEHVLLPVATAGSAGGGAQSKMSPPTASRWRSSMRSPRSMAS